MNHDEALMIIVKGPAKIRHLGEASAAAAMLAAGIALLQDQGVIGLPFWAPLLALALGGLGLVTGALAMLAGLTLSTARRLLTRADL